MLSALVHAGVLEAYAAHPPPFAVDRACFPPGANLLPLPTPLSPGLAAPPPSVLIGHAASLTPY